MKFLENIDTVTVAAFFVTAVRTSNLNYIYTFFISVEGVCCTVK